MEDIFIQALVTRSKSEDGLIDLLPDEIKSRVEEQTLVNQVQDEVSGNEIEESIVDNN